MKVLLLSVALLATPVYAQDTPPDFTINDVREMYEALHNRDRSSTVLIGGMNMANALEALAKQIIELNNRPNYNICVSFNLTINAQLDDATVKEITKSFNDAADKVKEACAAVLPPPQEPPK